MSEGPQLLRLCEEFSLQTGVCVDGLLRGHPLKSVPKSTPYGWIVSFMEKISKLRNVSFFCEYESQGSQAAPPDARKTPPNSSASRGAPSETPWGRVVRTCVFRKHSSCFARLKSDLVNLGQVDPRIQPFSRSAGVACVLATLLPEPHVRQCFCHS